MNSDKLVLHSVAGGLTHLRQFELQARRLEVASHLQEAVIRLDRAFRVSIPDTEDSDDAGGLRLIVSSPPKPTEDWKVAVTDYGLTFEARSLKLEAVPDYLKRIQDLMQLWLEVAGVGPQSLDWTGLEFAVILNFQDGFGAASVCDQLFREHALIGLLQQGANSRDLQLAELNFSLRLQHPENAENPTVVRYMRVLATLKQTAATLDQRITITDISAVAGFHTESYSFFKQTALAAVVAPLMESPYYRAESKK